MKNHKPSKEQLRSSPVVDVLEPRVLYSADSLSGLLPLLFDQAEDDGEQYLTYEPVPASPVEPISHLIFLDETVPDSQSLADSLDDENTQIVMIGQQDDGLLVISQALGEYESLDSVQIISHGEAGQLQLGSVRVDHATLLSNQVAVSRWAESLGDDADFLLLGCDLVGDLEGVRFIDELARLTGADVAASTDLTGHESLGADWDLEYQHGTVETEFALDDEVKSQWEFSLGTITVDTLVDQFDISTTLTLDELLVLQSQGEEVSLREAIHAANQGPASVDTINLGFGDHLLSIDGSDEQSGDLDILDDIIIVGQGSGSTSIQMTLADQRVLDVVDSDISVSGLKIHGGHAQAEGGGIRATGTSEVSLDSVEISGNTSDGHGGGIYASGPLSIQKGSVSGNTSDGDGGGIYNTGGETVVNSSTMSGNRSVGAGGAIFGQNVAFFNGSITDNSSSGSQGGALYIAGTLELGSFNLQNNTAEKEGGGIYVVGTYTIDSGLLNYNKSTSEEGGALYSEDTGVISNVDFTNNSALKDGGAIFTQQGLTVSSSGFQYNSSAVDGGAMHVSGALSISDSGFGNNTSGDDGGAVFVREALTIERVSFRENKAPNGHGGAIFQENNGLLSITGATFSLNSANSGGAISTDGSGDIRASTFVGNSATTKYTVIEASGGSIGVSSSIIHDNTPSSTGIGIFTITNVYTKGYNLFEFDSDATTDLNKIDPLLGAYDTGDGRVGSYTLLAGSPAINAGNAVTSQTTDGRGVALDEFADIGSVEYASDDSVIFWSDGDGSIYRSNADFSNVQPFIDGRITPSALSVDLDNQRLYWIEQSNSNVVYAALTDSSVVVPFIAGLANAQSLVVDPVGSHVYIAINGNGGNGRIDKYDLTTGAFQQTVVSAGISDPVDLAFDGNRIYWVEDDAVAETKSVRSTDLNGEGLLIHGDASFLTSVAIDTDSNYLYYAEDQTDTIGVLNTSTNTTESAYATTPDEDPDDLQFDESTGNLIFTAANNDDIITLDGTNGDNVNRYSHNQSVSGLAVTSTSVSSIIPLVVTNDELTVLEGNSVEINNANLLVTDANNTNEELVYTLLNSPLPNGSLIVDGVSGSTSFTAAQLEDPAIAIEYLHNGTETITDSLEFQVTDGVNTTGPFTVNVVITPQNDAPTLGIAGSSYSINEADFLPLSPGILVSNDVDNSLSDYEYKVTAQNHGWVQRLGLSLDVDDTFSYQELFDGDITFRHDGTETTDAFFSIELSDGEATSAPVTLSLTITEVNDAPTLSIAGGPFAIDEADFLELTPTILDSDDVDDAEADYIYRVTAQANGWVQRSDASLYVGESFSYQELLDGDITFRHDGSETTVASFAVELSDGDASSAAATLSLTINEINDAPTLNIAGGPFAIDEADFLALTPTILDSDDVDNPELDYEYQVTAQGNGWVQRLSVSLNVGETFTYQQLFDGDITFRHDGTETTDAFFSIELSDGEATTAPVTLSLTITEVNDAPTLSIAGGPFTIDEADFLALTPTILDSDDVDDAEADYIYRVTAQANGWVQRSGVSLNVGETFTYQQLFDGEMTFRHDGGETTAASFGVELSDGNATTAPVTLSLIINEINDAPTLSIAGGPFTIDEADFLALTPTILDSDDVDDAEADYIYRVTAQANGWVQRSGVSLNVGETFTYQQLFDGEMTFRHDGGETTTASFDIALSDGEASSAPVTLSLAINEINDAPTLSIAGGPFTIDEADFLNLSPAILVSDDVDNTEANYSYRVTAQDNGSVQRSGVSLNIGDAFTYQELTDGDITFRHNGSETTAGSFNVELSDGIASSAVVTLSMTIIEVNDAPTLSIAGGPFDIDEAGSLTLTPAILVSDDVDNPEADYLYQVTAEQNGSVQRLGLSLLIGETFTHQELSDGDISFRHNGSETTAASFNVELSDGAASSAVVTLSMTIGEVNDAPTLSIAGGPFTIDEADFLSLSPAILVSDDVDNPEADYLYQVTAEQNGSVQRLGLSLLVGETFTHQELSDGDISFRHNGSETTAASFNVELSDGVASSAAVTLSMSIVEVNDAPTLSIAGGPFTIDEADFLNLSPAILVSDDVDNTEADYSYRVTAQDNGWVQRLGVSLNIGDAFSYQELTDGDITFRHNGSETTAASFNVELSDGAASSAVVTLNMSIGEVNDAPTLSIAGGPFTIDEADFLSLSPAILVSDDVDNPEADYLYQVTAEQNGSVQRLGLSLLVGETFTHQELSDGDISFRHNGSETTAASFNVELSDGVASSAAVTLSMSIVEVNDAPTLSIAGGPFTIDEADFLNLSPAILVSDDVDNTEADYFYRVTAQDNGWVQRLGVSLNIGDAFTYQELTDGDITFRHDGSETTAASFNVELSDGAASSAVVTLSMAIVELNDAPTLSIAGAPFDIDEAGSLTLTPAILVSDDVDNPEADYLYQVTAEQNGSVQRLGLSLLVGETFTHQELSDGDISFRHNGSETTAASFNVELSDGVASSAAVTLSMSIVEVNDAPTLSIAGGPFTIDEADFLNLSPAILVSDDVDNTEADYFYRVTAQDNGWVQRLGVSLNIGDAFSYQELTDGDITFRHDGSETTAASFNVELSDGAASSAVVTLSMTIVEVNDAPTLSIAGAPFDIDEAGSLTLTPAILVSDDVDNFDADYLYRITTQQNGEVQRSGVSLSTGDTFTYQELSDGEMTFRHDGGETTSALFKIELSDGVASSAAVTLNMSIAEVNDAPTLSIAGGPFTIDEADFLNLSPAILVSDDVDNTEADYSYRVTAQDNGWVQRLGVSLNIGDAFTYQELTDGDITFRHDGSETTAASFNVELSDGAASSAVVTLSMTVVEVNDAPTLSIAGGPFTIDEAGSLRLTPAILVSDDVDNLDADYLYRITTQQNGEVLRSGVSLSTGDTFTHQELSAGEMTFRHDGSETTSALFEVELGDGIANSNAVTLKMSVNAIDDAPVWLTSEPFLQVSEGGSTVLDAQLVNPSDVDNAQSEFVYRLTQNTGNGAIEVSGRVLASGETFTQLQLDTGAVLYRHDGSEARSDSVSLVAFNQAGTTVVQTIDIVISAGNDAPILTVDDGTIQENLSGAVVGSVFVSDSDQNDAVVLAVDDTRFIIVDNVLALKSNESLDHELEPTLTLNVSATDSAGAVTVQQVTINVQDVNDKPELGSSLTETDGAGYQLPVDLFVDADGDTLAYSVTLTDGQPLPDWLSFDQLSREFQVLDETAVRPSLDVLVSVEDGRGGESSRIITLFFDPPLAAAEPVTENNPDLDELVISAAVPPSGKVLFNSGESEPSEGAEQASSEEGIISEELAVEVVDVHALVEPLPDLVSLDLTVLEQATGKSARDSIARSGEADIDSFDLSDLLRLPSSDFTQQSEPLSDAFNNQKAALEQQASLMQVLMGSSAGVTTGLSAGYLLWLIRGGTLMGSVLSSLPAWRLVDPLPVLGSMSGDIDGDDEDESLASIVDANDSSEDMARRGIELDDDAAAADKAFRRRP